MIICIFRKLLSLRLEKRAKKLFRNLQVYEKRLNFCFRPVRISVLELSLNVAPSICGFSLIAYHDRLNIFAVGVLIAISLSAIIVLVLLLKFLEFFEAATEDFKKSVLFHASRKKNKNEICEILKFRRSLLPLRVYTRLTYFKPGLTLGTMNAISNNIITLLLVE